MINMTSSNMFDNDLCKAGKHIFYKSKRHNSLGYPVCNSCSADVVDWERLYKRNIEDVDYTVEQLKHEAIRFEWWNKELDLKSRNHALKKGISELRNIARKRIITSIGPSRPFRDGYQTPYSGSSIFFAQHALGCCCRKCLYVWYGIPKDRALAKQEIDYLVELVAFYLRKRIPDLKD